MMFCKCDGRTDQVGDEEEDVFLRLLFRWYRCRSSGLDRLLRSSIALLGPGVGSHSSAWDLLYTEGSLMGKLRCWIAQPAEIARTH